MYQDRFLTGPQQNFSLESRKVFDFINNTSSLGPVRQFHLRNLKGGNISFSLRLACIYIALYLTFYCRMV